MNQNTSKRSLIIFLGLAVVIIFVIILAYIIWQKGQTPSHVQDEASEMTADDRLRALEALDEMAETIERQSLSEDERMRAIEALEGLYDAAEMSSDERRRAVERLDTMNE